MVYRYCVDIHYPASHFCISQTSMCVLVPSCWHSASSTHHRCRLATLLAGAEVLCRAEHREHHACQLEMYTKPHLAPPPCVFKATSYWCFHVKDDTIHYAGVKACMNLGSQLKDHN